MAKAGGGARGIAGLGGASGGRASTKQIGFISSIVAKGRETASSAFYRQKIGLDRVFGQGSYERIRSAGVDSNTIRRSVTQNFMSWERGFNPASLSSSQASNFLRGALFGHSRVRTSSSLERAVSGYVNASGASLSEFF